MPPHKPTGSWIYKKFEVKEATTVTSKELPASEVGKEAATLRAEFNIKDIPPHIIQHMQILEQQRSAQSQGSLRHQRSSGDHRATQSADGRDLSRDELRAMSKTEAAQKRQEREELRQRELMEQDRVDEVIKEWLRGRNRRALRRDKKVRELAICFCCFPFPILKTHCVVTSYSKCTRTLILENVRKGARYAAR